MVYNDIFDRFQNEGQCYIQCVPLYFLLFLEIFNSKSRIFTEIDHFPHFVNFWDKFFPFVAKIKKRVTYNLFNAEGNSNGITPSLDPLSNAMLGEKS